MTRLTLSDLEYVPLPAPKDFAPEDIDRIEAMFCEAFGVESLRVEVADA